MIITVKLDKSIVAAMVLAAGICSGAVDDANKMFSTGQPEEYPEELENCNPLKVTTSEDVVDPTDGKISFREACAYLEQHYKAPAQVCEDQWPKITFALPPGKRTVDVSDVVTIDDNKRPALFDAELTGRQPVIIDGGVQGITIRNIGTGSGLLTLNVAGVVSNVLFSGGTVSVGANQAAAADRNVNFENCAFEGGANDGPLVSSAWGNVSFSGCSFHDVADELASGAVSLNVSPDWVSRFECCTFTDFTNAPSVVHFKDDGGELRLANCTFANNAVSMADVMIETVEDGVRGTFRALNCIFADGVDKAYSKDFGNTNVYCPCEKPKKKGDLMVNIVTSDPKEVFDSQRTSRSVNGVVQYVYKPRHAFTARYGLDAHTFDDGVTMKQPVLDIFSLPQTGLYHSMGSYYVDDVETLGIEVTIAEDVTDPYDDEISLREAVAYGGEKDGSFAQGQAVTPTFGDGVTSLSVTGAIHVAADTVYKDFALVIQPGKDKTLTISSATNSQNGVFVQDAGTRLLQLSRVRFDRCGSIRGDGGVLDTAGRYRFDDCVFDCCWSTGVGGAICATNSADGIIYNVSASGCAAAGDGGVIASEGNLVGANLTFCGNTAQSGAAVLCAGGTNLFASVAFVDNVSETNGAVHVSGGACGIVNSIIIGDVTADGGATNIQYSLCGADIAKNEVFLDVGPLVGISSNGIEHLYYPLAPAGLAVGTGAYVFFAGENRKDDSREAGWLRNVFYSTDPDGLNPKAEVLFGSSKNRNTYLLYDLLGNLIESWDKKLQRALPASMGPVPKVVAVVSVTPGEPLVFDTAEAATNAAAKAVLTPSAEVAAALGSDMAKVTYRNMFELDVSPTSDGKWTVAAFLTPEDWTNVVQSARSATRQLPVAKLASQEYGVPLTDVPLTNCVPGFYYSLYSGTAITNINMSTDEPNRNILCGPNTSITIPLFPHPSPSSGFFAIGVGATRIASDTVRNVAREVGGGLYLGDDEIELDQGFVVIKGTDVRFVGNAVGNEQE